MFRISAVGGSEVSSCDIRAWTRLQFLIDVAAPVEVETDLGRAARGFRLDARDAGNAVHRLFDWTRDGNECLRSGRLAVIDDDDDAREISFRKDSDRQLPCGVDARQRTAAPRSRGSRETDVKLL